jgi:hypothetical protein
MVWLATKKGALAVLPRHAPSPQVPVLVTLVVLCKVMLCCEDTTSKLKETFAMELVVGSRFYSQKGGQEGGVMSVLGLRLVYQNHDIMAVLGWHVTGLDSLTAHSFI